MADSVITSVSFCNLTLSNFILTLGTLETVIQHQDTNVYQELCPKYPGSHPEPELQALHFFQ